MIRIDRKPGRPPLSVYDKATVKPAQGNSKISRAAREYEEALAFFTDPKNYRDDEKRTKDNFPFKVYKDKELVEALGTIFGTKCVYCESDFGAVTPRDIEHFRPKAAIDRSDGTSCAPGYFWLAGDWHNLLVSCPDCNRARNHSVPGQSLKAKLGKEAQFPLRDETKRVRLPTQAVSLEEPHRLLINPCIDEPSDYLDFDDEGLVRARVDVNGNECDRGRFSIDVYALQRGGLVTARRKALLAVIFLFEQLRIAVGEFVALKDEGAAQARVDAKASQILEIRNHLADLTTGTAMYLGTIRAYVRRKRASGGFDDLIKAGIDPEKLRRASVVPAAVA